MKGHPAHDHERTDVPIGLLVKFLIGLGVAGVVIVLALGGLWRIFDASSVSPRISAWSGPREMPPGPRLQVAPQIDLRAYREEQLKRLNSYGWADPAAKQVHIPIDRAMEMILQQGLPSRKPAATEERPDPQRVANDPMAK